VDRFDQFDFVAYLAPGALILISYAMLWPPSNNLKLPFGDATIAVALAIASYMLGRICSAIGAAAWDWYCMLPSQKAHLRKSNDEWLLTGLDRGQWTRFADLIQTRLSRTLADKTRLDSRWWKLGRQIYADVAKHGSATRLDAYNRSYTFYRAIQVAVAIIGFMVAVKTIQSHYYFLALWLVPLGIVDLACIGQTREYNTLYARELVQQFLVLPNLRPEETVNGK
jgi:hypothetical protein